MESGDSTTDENVWLPLDSLIGGRSPSYVQQQLAEPPYSDDELRALHEVLLEGPDEYLLRMEPHPVHEGFVRPNDAWRAWDAGSIRQHWPTLLSIVATEIELRQATDRFNTE